MVERTSKLLSGSSLADADRELERDGFYDPIKDDGAGFTSNRGLLTAAHLYFFTAYPMQHAWKSKGLLGNMRLHIEDIRDRSQASEIQREYIELSRDARVAPMLNTVYEASLGDLFSDPRFKLPLQYVEDIDFEALTITFKKLSNARLKLEEILEREPELRPVVSNMGENPITMAMAMRQHPEIAQVFMAADAQSFTNIEGMITRSGSKIIARNARTIVASFERVALKKLVRLEERLQGRLKASFQDLYRRLSGNRMGMPLMLIVESVLSDFYAMVRALNLAEERRPAAVRKRVIALQAGSQHIEYWSHALHSLGARELVVYGNPKNSQSVLTEDGYTMTSVEANDMYTHLVEVGVIEPTVSFTRQERVLIRRVYSLIDELKSSVVRPDTIEAVWDTFERLLIAEKECAQTIRESATASEDSKPMNVLVVLGTKTQIVLEMFIVDVNSLTQTAQTRDILERANFQLSGRVRSLTQRIQKYKQESAEGVVGGKRKS